MELKDYIAIFKKQEKVFWTIMVLSVLVAVVWQKSQRVEYQATLLLDIGRAGAQSTQDYTYDSFYRLQADERFADTVVRWLASPRVVEDIYSAANMSWQNMSVRDLQIVFGAKRLSSQVIEVTYTGVNVPGLKKISEAIVTTLNRYTNTLNKGNQEMNWFVVIGSDPIIRDARIPLTVAAVVGLILGVFMGFWTALLRHYFQPTKNNKQ